MFVYNKKERHLKVAKDKDDIWVLCVTEPYPDTGRVLKIEGNVSAPNRKVSLSVGLYGRADVKSFDRSKYKEFVLNIEDKPPVVNGNTLYMMDKKIRRNNSFVIDRLDLVKSANTLCSELPLLREKLQDLNNLCDQIEQHFGAQNQQINQDEKMEIDSAMISMANWQQDHQVIQNDGLNQQDNQKEVLIDYVDLDQVVNAFFPNAQLNAPDEGAVELHIPEEEEGEEEVQVIQNEDLPIDQGLSYENDQEMVEAGPDPEADAQHLQNAQLVIDGCRARIQQSLQPIDQILDLLIPLCQKRQTIKDQTPGAVNLVLPSGYNLLKRRRHLHD